MFNPKNDATANQQLKVQRISICGKDREMYDVGSPAIVPPANLGRAELFGILGASAVSNTGSSVINGDLGSYPTNSITGFPPGIVNGTIHHADSAAANAQTDALALYTLLAAHSSTVLSATSFNLDGSVLSPGYYSAGTSLALATSGAGTLTLDAGGNSNALFVIKSGSTLTTGAGGLPTISLINGAKASNVFFIVGSSATINVGTAGTFNGNIIAQASVTDTTGGIVNGRLIALTAAVTLSAATVLNRTSSFSGGTLIVHIREKVNTVYMARCKVDSANSELEFNQSQIRIQDSAGFGETSDYDKSTLTHSSDQKDIQITDLSSLADGDCLSIDYITEK